MKNIITQERLKELVHYNKETGVFTSLVDWKRYCKVGDTLGREANNGYIVLNVDYKQYLAHRLAWLYEHGEFPNVIDHLDCNKHNNRLSNLKNTTHFDNSKNYQRRRANTTSGQRGVHWNKGSDKWTASIGYDGKSIHLGSFESKAKALEARLEAEKKYGYTNRGV